MRRSPTFNDLATGLLLIAVAALGFWLAMDLRIGTAQRMGPGYLPRAMCAVLGGLGALIVVRSFIVSGAPREPWAWMPLALVSASIAAFALGIEKVGLFVSIVALVVVASLAAPDKRAGEVAILSVGLAAFSSFVFVKMLGLPIPLWPAASLLGLS